MTGDELILYEASQTMLPINPILDSTCCLRFYDDGLNACLACEAVAQACRNTSPNKLASSQENNATQASYLWFFMGQIPV